MGTGSESIGLSCRHATCAATDTASIAAAVHAAESRRRREVKSGEGAGVAKEVSAKALVLFLDGKGICNLRARHRT